MADRWRRLAAVTLGSRALLPVEVTARSAAGITLAPLTREAVGVPVTPTGEIVIDGTTAAVTGAWTADPREQPVLVMQAGLRAGDLLLGLDGQVTMARAVGLGPDATWWSPFVDGHAAQSQEGFEVVGHVDLP
jgi:hypothetical protein